MPSSGSRQAPTQTDRVVLDTSAYSHLRTGHAALLDVVARAQVVLLTPMTLGELEAGFRLGDRYAENRRVLDEFLQEPFVAVLPLNHNACWRYGGIFSDLRRAGTPVPTNDIWIGATTMENGAHLLTFDSDFARIQGLEHTLFVPAA